MQGTAEGHAFRRHELDQLLDLAAAGITRLHAAQLAPAPPRARSAGSVQRRPLIVATSNPGKLREFRALLADLPFDLHSLGELGVASPEESGASFLENAMLKARHASAAAAAAGIGGASMRGVAAIADDSGLEVDALGGAPGIYSARYAGEGADDAANNAKLIAALAGSPRRAAARALSMRIGAAFPARRARIRLIAEGVWEGTHIWTRRAAAGGFGYDPYFYLAGAAA